MRIRMILLSMFLGLTLAGCSTVMSTHPIGDEPLTLVAEEWEGTWSDSEDFLEIRVVDTEAGEVEAAWIERKGEAFELERVGVFLRQSGDAIFGNVLEEPDDDAGTPPEDGTAEPPYAFFRLARDGEKLVIWWPEVEAFKALVEAGTLPGTVTEGGDVVLGALNAEHLELLGSDDSAALYDWKEPGVLFRSGGQ